MGASGNRLQGKVAIVTGAARGMGAAEARLFAAEGARVLVCDVIDDEARALADDIGESARSCHLDVTSEEEWTTAVDEARSAFGHVDVLVNNAGVAEAAPLEEMSLESYRRVIDVNQVGVFLGMKAVTRPMTEAGGGSIVNISSIDGMIGMNGILGYVASKWAVRGMTKAAAMELGGRGIRVNSIHPGFVRTQLGVPDGVEAQQIHDLLDSHTQKLAPLGRSGEPMEIARLALFLASDDSSYSTGSEFVADGGLIAGYPAPGSA